MANHFTLFALAALDETQEAFRRHFESQFELFKEMVNTVCAFWRPTLSSSRKPWHCVLVFDRVEPLLNVHSLGLERKDISPACMHRTPLQFLG